MAETQSSGLCKQANEGLTALKPTEPTRRREPDGVYAVITDQYLVSMSSAVASHPAVGSFRTTGGWSPEGNFLLAVQLAG